MNTEEMKRLAEPLAAPNGSDSNASWWDSFHRAANPAAILTLIQQRDELLAAHAEMAKQVVDLRHELRRYQEREATMESIMTDRIRSEFEKWATGREFPDLTQSMGRYNRAVVRWMWEAWQEQAKDNAETIAALDRSQKIRAGLLEENINLKTSLFTAVAKAASLDAEVERLNETISRLSVEGQDAVEM